MTQEPNNPDLDFSDVLLRLEPRLNDIAYVKKETTGLESVWTIYNEQGEKMGYAANREVAIAMAHQSELTVFNVH